MEQKYQRLLDVVKLSLWGGTEATADQDIFEEMRLQGISSLPGSVLDQLSLTQELFDKWKSSIVKTVFRYYNYKHIESKLPLTVPYVILKGTSASQYYPHPELRSLGDIDIMTRHEDYNAACEMMVLGGYKEVTSESERRRGRHRSFARRDILVEVHSFFASVTDIEKARYLDELIIQNISTSHVLPDKVNGLVLLEHISQHFRNGLGLRQIIDWMMFVDKCLSDEEWSNFLKMAQKIGLEKLAIAATRMCELYIGLPERKWTAGVDDQLCDSLLQYVLSSGNFGNKWTDTKSAAISAFSAIKNPKDLFQSLQKVGIENWKAARKHKILRPFAWIYQAGRFTAKGLRRQDAGRNLKEEYMISRQRLAMFKDLGLDVSSGKLVTYKNWGVYC